MKIELKRRDFKGTHRKRIIVERFMLKFRKTMNKVEMKRTQLSEKFGIDTICNLFCMFARGRRKIPPEACYDPRRDMEIRAHCREAENALAAHHNIKLID